MCDEPNCSQSEVVLYQTEDGRTRLEVQLEHESVLLTQAHMAELFQTTKQNVSLHTQIQHPASFLHLHVTLR